jgi:hypothetical protein
MIRRLLQVTGVVKSPQERTAKLYRDLLRHEAKIGGQLFGPVAPGGRREFFCLDENTWVWHEEWKDASGNTQVRTTRYDVRPEGILKAQDGRAYQLVSDQEAARLQEAVTTYNRRVKNEIYKAVL